MLFILKKITSALILPPTSLILLAIVGLWLIRRHPRAGKTLITLALTALLILSLPITGNALIHNLETNPPITEAQLKDIQAIVVLGGRKNNQAPEYGNTDTVNQWSLERLRYAAYLQRLTGKPILVTGGAPFGGRPEADTMAESLKHDFNAKTIWIEDQANDTAENAAYSAKLLKQHGISKIALVSQAWHTPRAVPLFEQQGLKVYPAPTGFTREDTAPFAQWLPKASALDKSSMAIREWIAMIVQ